MSVRNRHHHIEANEIIRPALGERQTHGIDGLGTIGRQIAVAVRSEDGVEQLAAHRIIVDDQEFHGRSPVV